MASGQGSPQTSMRRTSINKHVQGYRWLAFNNYHGEIGCFSKLSAIHGSEMGDGMNTNTTAIVAVNVQAWRLEKQLQAQRRRQEVVKIAMGSALRDALQKALRESWNEIPDDDRDMELS